MTENQQQQFQSQSQQNAQTKQQKQKPGCPRCGHQNPEGALFCEECGAALDGSIRCPHCGAPIPPGGDMCEVCGAWLQNGKCAFCGAPIEEGAAFCSECGNPTGGIRCPACGTLSFFDYCPKCHTKLTEQADAMLETLKQRPEVREWLESRQEYAELQRQIQALEQGSAEAGTTEPENPTQETAPKLDQSAAILLGRMVRERKARQQNRNDSAVPHQDQFQEKKGFAANKTEEPSADSAEERKKKLAEMKAHEAQIQKAVDASAAQNEEKNKKMEELKARQYALKEKLSRQPPMPKELTTNQAVRNFQMAVKPPVVKGWICNAFHCLHADPMQCTRPGDGGHWITE